MVTGRIGVEGWTRSEAATGEGTASNEEGECEEGYACGEDHFVAVAVVELLGWGLRWYGIGLCGRRARCLQWGRCFFEDSLFLSWDWLGFCEFGNGEEGAEPGHIIS